ncbi:MAG TPA: fatty acid desaturase [Candidatus Limnocylindrales bacterium]|nr:fatty acid desaturase [Candidatus Limnocylindrales bacterium]
MAFVAPEHASIGVWRFSRSDAILVTLAGLHGLALAASPTVPVIAAGMWWNANTIAHNFIHKPFFRSRGLNRAFSAVLTLLLGIPQTLWRDRHLAHHAGAEWRLRVSRQLCFETMLVFTLMALLATLHPRFFLLVYLPGYLGGLLLCAMQGYWEHPAGAPTSHYGRLYNFFWFNDGYHAEHHAHPAAHWSGLPRCKARDAKASRWPPLLRWLDVRPLELLERLVLRWPGLQRFVLRCHRRAFQRLIPEVETISSATIVGGGLFPRTALILRELLPGVRLTIVDADARNLETAQTFLGDGIEYRNERYTSDGPLDCDLTVIPLCLSGDREAIYRQPPSRVVLIHDWIWRRRGSGTVVSPVLLKRLNMVRR